MRKFYSFILIATALLILQSCQKRDAEVVRQPNATNYSYKVASEWMHTLEKIVQSESKNPPHASRIYAYAGIGLYEAVLPGMEGYQSLEGQIAGLNNLPKAQLFGQLDYTASANEALYQIASKVFVTLKPENLAVIENLHTKYLEETRVKVSNDVLEESVAFGKAVAAAIMDRANNDGFAATRGLVYTIPSTNDNPGFWSPTGAALSPLEPFWGQLKCFAMASGSACDVPSTIAFSTDPGSAFYKQAQEVLTVNTTLTPEQKSIALWWSDGTAQTATPPGHWIAIADEIAASKNLSLGKAAEMYALLNIAMADAFISCWDAKYKLNLLRPVSYIRSFVPGNASWSPLLTTPPFPEYPSGHSVASAAAGEILTGLFGTFAFTDSANTYLGLPPRNYSSFTAAASEAAISRLYGGIHYREAIENGVLQGKEVSKAVTEKIKLRK